MPRPHESTSAELSGLQNVVEDHMAGEHPLRGVPPSEGQGEFMFEATREVIDHLAEVQADAGRLREALRKIVTDSRNPELATVEHLRGIALAVIDDG